jgi:uncharacterized Fe-S cluster-containing MiaB family protein
MSKEKSMTLEQFKAELETDATKRNSAQEETIKRLIAENKKKDEELKITLTALKQMFAMCKTVHCGGGVLCVFCGFKNECAAALKK